MNQRLTVAGLLCAASPRTAPAQITEEVLSVTLSPATIAGGGARLRMGTITGSLRRRVQGSGDGRGHR